MPVLPRRQPDFAQSRKSESVARRSFELRDATFAVDNIGDQVNNALRIGARAAAND
jgi:hypothetical protein